MVAVEKEDCSIMLHNYLRSDQNLALASMRLTLGSDAPEVKTPFF